MVGEGYPVGSPSVESHHAGWDRDPLQEAGPCALAGGLWGHPAGPSSRPGGSLRCKQSLGSHWNCSKGLGKPPHGATTQHGGNWRIGQALQGGGQGPSPASWLRGSGSCCCCWQARRVERREERRRFHRWIPWRCCRGSGVGTEGSSPPCHSQETRLLGTAGSHHHFPPAAPRNP